MTEDDLISKTVAKVTAQVMREMRGSELKAFDVDDLSARLKDLGPSNAAWTISYSTASGIRDLGSVAWTISYSTASGIRNLGASSPANEG